MRRESARILMTGSDLVGISSYVKLLQMDGYEVYTAFSGADLLDLLSKYNFDFDLIVTDVRIPGLSSYELGDFIAMNSGSDIPIIGMAEFPRDEQILMDSGESFALIIEKGFTANELLDAVDSVVNIDTSLAEGMSEQQISIRAKQLDDTSTVPMNQDEYMDAAQKYVQNKGHQNLIDKFKNM
jgi:CheY-like chemotaxis protein